jgi:glycosyltransferase involved in cell wall biosynthesis
MMTYNDNKDLVSVIIPTYKRPTFLKRAIESILTQKYNNIEIIVVDDNNPETQYRKETEILMNKYANIKNIKYIKHEYNRNGSAARNTGIKNSKGKYITFLDDDDEMLPYKIEHQVNKMKELDGSWGGCYTSYIKVNKSGTIQKSSETREGKLLIDALMRNIYIGSGSNLLFRREVVEDVGEFDESFIRNQDFEYLVRICNKYKIAYVDSIDLIVHYEIRGNSKTYEEIVEIDNHFLNTFNSLIELQTQEDKRRIYSMVALNRLNTAFRKKCLLQGIKELIYYKVSLISLIKYIWYLLHRIITKSSYGFKL